MKNLCSYLYFSLAAIATIIASLNNAFPADAQLELRTFKKILAIQQVEITRLKTNTGSVGDVRASVLTPAQFREKNGSSWTLMDGSTLALTDELRILTGMTTVPDARGRFLRMKDHSAGVDVAGDVAIGTKENDSTKRPNVDFTLNTNSVGNHSHSISDPGHSHNFRCSSEPTTSSGEGVIVYSQPPIGHWFHAWDEIQRNVTGITIPNSGAHGHSGTIDGGGDAETRPKNVVVNYFIKINH
ncbi:MAG: hypothetical protein HQK53_15930 [Oligoflexia bacterium]|nr:hypothetical protein [Oligoflexia bacterium]